jgi:hypothetical protein
MNELEQEMNTWPKIDYEREKWWEVEDFRSVLTPGQTVYVVKFWLSPTNEEGVCAKITEEVVSQISARTFRCGNDSGSLIRRADFECEESFRAKIHVTQESAERQLLFLVDQAARRQVHLEIAIRKNIDSLRAVVNRITLKHILKKPER